MSTQGKQALHLPVSFPPPLMSFLLKNVLIPFLPFRYRGLGLKTQSGWRGLGSQGLQPGVRRKPKPRRRPVKSGDGYKQRENKQYVYVLKIMKARVLNIRKESYKKGRG